VTTFLGAVLVASLLGSLHCAGMCGGVVALCVGVDVDGARGSRWPMHAGYNLGRLVTYAALGAVSGGVGAAVDLGGSSFGLFRPAALVAGGLMIGFGALALLRAHGVRLSCMSLPPRVQRIFEHGLRFATSLPPVRRATLVGLLTGFLPCGWLYAFVLSAAATGSAPTGALTMASFWLGTVPVMIGVGVGIQRLAVPLRRHLPTLTASVLIALGVLAVVGRLEVPAYATDVRTLVDAAGDRGASDSTSDTRCTSHDHEPRRLVHALLPWPR